MNYDRPIFIHGLQGGGTGILWNIITSHAECLGPRFETNEIFQFSFLDFAKFLVRRQGAQLINMLELIRLSMRYRFDPRKFHVFDMENVLPRDGAVIQDPGFRSAVVQRLEELKLDHGNNPRFDKEDFRTPQDQYTPQEIQNTRLTAKNLEGCCFLRGFFEDLFSGAQFVSIVRHGLAICESNLRHGRAFSATEAGANYRVLVKEMLRQSGDSNSILVRYEDLVDKPKETIARLYDFLQLEWRADQKFRMAVREFIGREKTWLMSHQVQKGKNWFSLEELSERFLQKDINQSALERLPEGQRAEFISEAAEVLSALDYHY
jgi:Sulfotransferase family